MPFDMITSTGALQSGLDYKSKIGGGTAICQVKTSSDIPFSTGKIHGSLSEYTEDYAAEIPVNTSLPLGYKCLLVRFMRAFIDADEVSRPRCVSKRGLL